MSVRFLPSFVDDLEEAYDFVLNRNPRAAIELVERVDRLLGLLAEFPEMGVGRHDLGVGLRSLRVRGFPHLVFYRLVESDVVAVRLVHGARRLRASLFQQ